MTLSAALDMVTSALGLFFGLIVLGMSRAPGWHHLRWFAGAAISASGYALTNIPMSVPASDAIIVWSSRVSLVFAGIHGLCWFPYIANLERRPLSRLDKGLMSAALGFGLLSMIPGALVAGEVTDLNFEWLGMTYRDAVPTPLGAVAYAFYCSAIVLVTFRLGRLARQGDLGALAQALSLGLLLAAAISDSLTAARVWSVPYLLNAGFLSEVVAVGTTIVVRFIASARALERSSKQLREAQEQLVMRERLAAVGELSAIVAHEVRNPLGVIYNVVSQLRRTTLPGTPSEALLAMLQEEAERLTRMVGALLDYARPTQPAFAHIPVEPLLLAAAHAVVSTSKHTSPDVQVEVAPNTPEIHGDQQMIRQAVINLIDNAIQAPGRRSAVQVRARPVAAGRQVEILVSDDGVGIPPGLERRIFDPFFTTRAQGTGLGLSIVERIIDLHGGSVSVTTTQGGGATFIIVLPSEAATSEAAA